MKKLVNLYFACSLFAVFVFEARADVKLPAIFGDNMVLQQQSQVAVWGWAKPNTGVRITGSWDKKTYSVTSDAQGCWRVKIATPAAGFTPCTLTISDGKAIVLGNILIGEVWICSGQSNMEMPMKGYRDQPVEGGPEAIAASANPGIRCFTLKKASKAAPQDDCVGAWEVANPQTTPGFTAAGYFFGRLINQSLNVPVGLIHTSWGGSRIEAWMTPNSLKDIPEKPVPASDADIKVQNGTPTVLYNGMLHPIAGYGIRGAIWYQGESNREEPALYVKMFDAMVREWRNIWGVGEFPFYYCQIAPYNYGGGVNSGYIREAQAKGMTTTPNTGMAVLMDAESTGCIHPPKKRDAGERMAFWALAKTYGLDKMQYRSPELKSLEIEGRVAIVTFDMNVDPGLTTYGKEILNFRIAGKDKRFYSAKAAYSGNKVYVFSPAVAEPVAVRYCFDDTSATELFTVEGNLPVSSFRTDDW
ncbi:MAG: sialate O-acetylesterase [Bacteroidales bacterium]|jgi:sialate O-acetylesterase|nr:sialate O-acetylesterase [Bacteroidales bacterium]